MENEVRCSLFSLSFTLWRFEHGWDAINHILPLKVRLLNVFLRGFCPGLIYGTHIHIEMAGSYHSFCVMLKLSNITICTLIDTSKENVFTLAYIASVLAQNRKSSIEWGRTPSLTNDLGLFSVLSNQVPAICGLITFHRILAIQVAGFTSMSCYA